MAASKKSSGKAGKKPNRKSSEPKIIRNLHKKAASFLLIEAILYGLAALFIFIKPIEILTSLTFVFGLFLGTIGLYQSINGIFIKDKNTHGRNLTIAFGIINFILGLVFLVQPSGALYTIVYAFAILFFVKAVKSLIFSIKFYREKIGNYKFEIAMSVIMLVLSSFLMFFPKFGVVTFMYYIGIILVLYAISDVRMYKKMLHLK